VPTKRRATKKRKPISAKTRTADDKLREALRSFDLKTFDRALTKAFKPTARS